MAVVKILVVTDDEGGFFRVRLRPFHLGEFIQVLRQTRWHGFTIEVTTAHRAERDSGIGADIYDFRFTSEALESYDVVFFFSIADVAEEETLTNDAQRREEAAAIADFMARGGGYFAAGDHEDLGGAINMHVPRVRSMRRWLWNPADNPNNLPDPNPYRLPVAPPRNNALRHDTLRKGRDSVIVAASIFPYQFNDQSDDIPQTMAVKRYVVRQNGVVQSTLPHPLLCSPLGVIDVLPDHMHEGWCEEPEDLTAREGLPGRMELREYPLLADGTPLAPELIALGSVAEPHETFTNGFLNPETTRATPFGLISAYDGHRIGIGRAVCDSTWHHFININVIGTTQLDPGDDPIKRTGFYLVEDGPVTADYEKIKHYYRNLVYWLVPPLLTRRIIVHEIVEGVRQHPQWEEVKGDLRRGRPALAVLHDAATLAEDYFRRTRGHCFAWQIVVEMVEAVRPAWGDGVIEAWQPAIVPVEESGGCAIDASRLPDSFRHVGRRVILGTVIAAGVQVRAKSRGRIVEHGEAFDRIAARFAQMLPDSMAMLAQELAATRDALDAYSRWAEMLARGGGRAAKPDKER